MQQEAASIATAASKLSMIVERAAWRVERERLRGQRAALVKQLVEREADAKASERAQAYHDDARDKLRTAAEALERAREPRPTPPVYDEEAIEPSIQKGAAVPDDVLAWVARLSASERSALAARVSRLSETGDRADGFAVALANYIADRRMSKAFYAVAKNPRTHFGWAAYAKLRADAETASATSGAPLASARKTAPQGAAPEPGSSTRTLASADARASTDERLSLGVGSTIPQASTRGTAEPKVLAPTETREAPLPANLAARAAPSEVPYRAGMEQMFRQPLGDIQAYTGMSGELAPHGARALSAGGVVLFADAQPSPAIVAHEVTHEIQSQQAGGAAPMAAGVVAPSDSPAEAEADGIAARVAAHGLGARLPPITAAPAAHVHLAPATLEPSAASAAAEDGRVAATAAKPQLKQHGHAMQYYRLHQPSFLDAVRTRLLAANLPPGSPQLSWTSGPGRFVEQLGFALTGPEAKELPELLYPSDPWALIDAHRTMDADPTLATGAMGWSPAAGLVLAVAFERSVRASLPRVAARYVAEQGTPSASLLVAAHPMDRVVAEALVADGVVTLGANRAATTGKAAGAPAGYDVQTGGIRLVMSYRWLGDVDPTLWHWLAVDDPADATLEEVSFALWCRTEYAYGLTRVGGYVAVPTEWARQVPGVQVREATGGPTLDRFDRSPVEELAASKLADGAALVQGAQTPAGDAARATSPTARTGTQPEAHESAPDRAQLLDALDATSVILDELTRQLGPWGLACVLAAGRSFVARQRAAAPGATPDALALWAPVVTGQRAIVRDAATGLLEVQKLLAEAGVTPAQLSPRDRAQNAHPGLQVLYGYAQAAGTAQLVDSARTVLAQARAAHAMLPVALIARASQDAGHELSQLSHAGQGSAGDRAAAARARALGADHVQLAGEVATLEGQVMATGRPDPVLLETAGLDADTLAFRARIAQLQASLSTLGHALDAADQGLIAALANLSAGARMVLTGHHLDLASQALGEIDTALDASQPAAVNARYDAMPPSPAREYGRQFELRDTRKAQLARAHERFAAIAKVHGLDGALFHEAEHAIRDAQIRALVANVAVLLAVGVISGGVAAVAGDFAAGLVGGGRAVTTIGEATGALRTARVVGGVTNVVVDAGANAAAQTALNGDHLGSSFAENLLSNAAVRAALRPLHAAIRTWGGLDEEALALWTQQGARGKLALAKTAVVTAELVTAGATSYVVHRLATLARGAQPDDETVATWAVQGATLVLARLVHTRLDAVMERLKGAGARAGELVARAARQQARALTYQSAEVIERGAAMQLLIEHQQLTQDELAFWRRITADPAALRTLGIDGEQAAARLAAAEAQSAELQGLALRYLPLRLAGLEQEVAGSRLWVGDTEQIAEGLANAKAARLPLTVTPPPYPSGAGVPTARIWRITLGDEALEIRERARVGRVREAVPGDEVTARTVAGAKRAATHDPTGTKQPESGKINDRDTAAPHAEWATARAGIAAGHVPPEAALPATNGNHAGIARLHEINVDRHIPATVYTEFLRELSMHLERMETPPEDLHAELKTIAYGSPEKYLRKGPRLSSGDFKKLGGLKRALSLKWLCSKVNVNLLGRANKLDPSIPADPRGYTWPMAQKIVDLIKAGRLEFDPIRDVDVGAMVGDWPRGASGWYFAGGDVADGTPPKELVTQLAVGPEYGDAYQIAEVPADLALSHSSEDSGAFRPTALDLTSAREGLLNPDPAEPYGRTNPQAPGQLPTREVLMTPLPLSKLKRGPLVMK